MLLGSAITCEMFSYMNLRIVPNTFAIICNSTTPFYFSGSYPPFENGLHLKIRQIVSPNALKKGFFLKASSAYCEQVG